MQMEAVYKIPDSTENFDEKNVIKVFEDVNHLGDFEKDLKYINNHEDFKGYYFDIDA